MKKLTIVILIVCIICSSGCTNAHWKNVTSLGCDFKIEMYSGGQVVKTWQSSGKVLTEQGSDGWIFEDKSTGKLVRVSGTVVVTQM